MRTTTRFGTIKAAKDYLAGTIADEAQRQGVPLSKVEREMLCFTEEGGLSKHMERVCEEFDRECNEDEYEAKIGSMVRSLESHLIPEEKDMWDDAVLRLCYGDHYLLVLIDAGAPRKSRMFPIPKVLRPWLPDVGEDGRGRPGYRRRLILVALLISVIIFGIMFLVGRR